MRAPELLDEARRMPQAAIELAREMPKLSPPEHLVALDERVRSDHRALIRSVHAALYERFHTVGDYINVFYAAADLAVMERVAREELSSEDRRTLRHWWETLLSVQCSSRGS
jgi:hypothetical protein